MTTEELIAKFEQFGYKKSQDGTGYYLPMMDDKECYIRACPVWLKITHIEKLAKDITAYDK